MEKGTIFKFHNDLDTDQIIASQYLLLPNLDEMKGHAFESLDPDFAKKVKPGDFVVGGENFGCGSSREQAPGRPQSTWCTGSHRQILRKDFLQKCDQHRASGNRL